MIQGEKGENKEIGKREKRGGRKTNGVSSIPLGQNRTVQFSEESVYGFY